MECSVEQTHELRNMEETSTANNKSLAKSQPFLLATGAGVAVSKIKSLMRQVNRLSPKKLFKFPRFSKSIPHYMRNNYIKYPAMFFVLLVAIRKFRSTIQ